MQCAKMTVSCEAVCQLKFEVDSKLTFKPAWIETEQDKHFLPVQALL